LVEPALVPDDHAEIAVGRREARLRVHRVPECALGPGEVPGEPEPDPLLVARDRASAAQRPDEPLEHESRSRRPLAAGDPHALDEARAAGARAAREDIAADRGDVAEHVAQVARDRDLLDRIPDLAALDPVTERAARVVAGDHVDPLAHEL